MHHSAVLPLWQWMGAFMRDLCAVVQREEPARAAVEKGQFSWCGGMRCHAYRSQFSDTTRTVLSLFCVRAYLSTIAASYEHDHDMHW